MEIFWDTIARYNAATWPVQIVLVAAGVALTVWLYRRPTGTVRKLTKLYLALLNAWIAVAYYSVYCAQRGLSLHTGLLLGSHGRRLGVRPLYGIYGLRADLSSRPLHDGALSASVSLSGSLPAAGTRISGHHHARHAVLRGRVHRRPARWPFPGGSTCS